MNDLVATQTCGTTGANSLPQPPECLSFRQKRNGVKRSGEISRCSESFIRPISGNSTRFHPKSKRENFEKERTPPRRSEVEFSVSADYQPRWREVPAWVMA